MKRATPKNSPPLRAPEIVESDINLIAESAVLEGKITLPQVSRVHGVLRGEVIAPAGSELVIAENGLVEGSIAGDIVFIDGFVRGDVRARTKITVSATGRVVGNLEAPRVSLAFGSFFEGRCRTEALAPESTDGSLSAATAPA